MENLIETIDISKIKNNKTNPRNISDEQLKKLMNSIKEFPEMLKLRPLIVNDKFEVLGGNMRLKACKELGIKKVSIIKADKLTKKQQKEFIIKDNVSFGSWDWDLLSNDWQGEKLNEWGLNGFDFEGGNMTESFGEDYIEEINDPINNNHVVVTLTMPVDVYNNMDSKINQLINEHKEIICKVQN